MSAEDKVNCLQDLRYSLETENSAYTAQQKVAKRLKKKRIQVSEDDLFRWDKDFMFVEKNRFTKTFGI